MTDTAGSTLPQQYNDQLRHTLTVREVSEKLVAAGFPRSERQIKRYCASGFLDAKKIPGPTGEQYFVAAHSIPKLIGDLAQWQAQAERHGQPRPDVTGNVTPEKTTISNMDVAGHGLAQSAMTATDRLEKSDSHKSVTSDYVLQLEKRIEEKDDVIGLLKGQLTTKDDQIKDMSSRFANLSERFADTQKLVGAMQRMLAPLLGQSDPYTAPESREVHGVDNSKAAQS